MKLYEYILFFLSFVFVADIYSQIKIDDNNYKEKIEALYEKVPGLNEKIKVNIGKTTLQTFLTGIGKTHNLNVTVDPNLDIPLTINFADETVGNVLLFILEQYNLNLKVTGTIMSISKKTETVLVKEIDIKYDKRNNLLSYELSNDPLHNVVKRIVELTDINIVIDPALSNKQVSGFIKNLSFDAALEKLSLSNNLTIEKQSDNTFYIKIKDSSIADNSKNIKQGVNQTKNSNIDVKVFNGLDGKKSINLNAINQPIKDIIKEIFAESDLNFVFMAEPIGNVSVNLKDVLLNDALQYIFSTTTYTYEHMDGVYLIGLRKNEKLRNTKLYKLQYRELKDVVSVIPLDLTEGVIIKEFPELNGLVLSGSAPNIAEIEKILKEIDQPVPVVMIELIIVDVRKSSNINMGVEAGLGDKPVKTSGAFLPGLDVTLSSSTINEFLNTVGLTRLGRVTPNFYMSLSALESNGTIDIKSTPRLATLNSHEAILSIGETNYYLEQQQSIIGTQNPQTVITNIYKPVNADFSITIKPTVSGDEQVTLQVSVNQSVFTNRIAPDAPPGQTSRDFKSEIRVKNEEMIVLGGLERVEKSQTGTGLPWISKIPVLRWFFGKRQKTNDNSKLIIFIKPTIIY